MDRTAQQSVVKQQEHKLVLGEPAPRGVGHESACALGRCLGVPWRAHSFDGPSRWRLGECFSYCAGYALTYPPNPIIYQSNAFLLGNWPIVERWPRWRVPCVRKQEMWTEGYDEAGRFSNLGVVCLTMDSMRCGGQILKGCRSAPSEWPDAAACSPSSSAATAVVRHRQTS